jgi:hypothetical protein
MAAWLTDEVADGAVRWCFFEGDGALVRASATVAGSSSTRVSREVREADQLKKKRGIGSAHRKRVAQQGWRLSGPILARGGGLGARASSGQGRDVKEGGAQAARVWSGKKRGDGRPWRHL